MVEQQEKKSWEFSVAGFKIRLNNTMIAMAIPIATTVGGAMWGAFEFYKDYMDMRGKIQRYVAPDLSGFDKRLAVIEENSQKTADYTRDIKNDLRDDIRKLEKVVESVERTTKQSQRETETDLRQLRREIDTKIQRALDNPLAGK